MKKAILITAGAIAGTTSLISAGVFLPSLFINSSPSAVKVDSNNVFVSKTAKSSVSVKEAIMGTNKVNNGNYVLYFGSEGIDSNFKFLYNVPKIGTTVDNEKEKQLLKREKKLSGDFWNAINYVTNNIKAKEDMVQPEFIAYVNLLGDGVTKGRSRVAQETTDILKEIIDARDTYKNWSAEARKELVDKYNFVKTSMTASAPLQTFLGNDVKTFYANLKLPFQKFDPSFKDPRKPVIDVVEWKVWPENIPLKTNPFDTYSTWDRQTKYYDESSYTNEFRSLWEFIKTNPLFTKRPPKDINTNEGFILGYKDGQLTNFYDGSFESEKTEGDGSGGTGGENNGSGGESGNGNNNGTGSESEKPSSKSWINNFAEEDNEVAPLPSAKNTFYTWLSTVYSKKKDN